MSLSPTEWVCMRACVIPVVVREIKEGCCKNLSVSCIFRAHTTHQRRHRGQNAVFQGKQTFVAQPTTVSIYPCFSNVFLKAYLCCHACCSGDTSLLFPAKTPPARLECHSCSRDSEMLFLIFRHLWFLHTICQLPVTT